MTDCRRCKFAEWDCAGYYNSKSEDWFVCGCIKDLDQEDQDDCDGYEENEQ